MPLSLQTEASPFQFRSGQYSDKLYDEQVKLFAPGYAQDAVLRERVCIEATRLFEQLDASDQMSKFAEMEFEYCGVPLRIVCSCPP